MLKKNSIGDNLDIKIVSKSTNLTTKTVSLLLMLVIVFSLTGCKINLSKETSDNKGLLTTEDFYLEFITLLNNIS